MNTVPLRFVEFSFSSSLAILELVRPITEKLADVAGFNADQIYWIWLATQEALNNALKHGNQMSDRKVVFFRIELQENALQVTVRDQGDGFDPASVPDPTQVENLLKSSGRGLFYIRQFMDQVSLSFDQGTQIVMIKHRPEQGAS
jgi:serine/threonine-protein kinase RsbW